jgi:hypothetical protein
MRRYGCQSDQIQSYVRSRSQPSGCLDDEDVARRATHTCREEEAHIKPEPGLPAYSSIMSNVTGSGIPTVTRGLVTMLGEAGLECANLCILTKNFECIDPQKS